MTRKVAGTKYGPDGSNRRAHTAAAVLAAAREWAERRELAPPPFKDGRDEALADAVEAYCHACFTEAERAEHWGQPVRVHSRRRV